MVEEEEKKTAGWVGRAPQSLCEGYSTLQCLNERKRHWEVRIGGDFCQWKNNPHPSQPHEVDMAEVFKLTLSLNVPRHIVCLYCVLEFGTECFFLMLLIQSPLGLACDINTGD